MNHQSGKSTFDNLKGDFAKREFGKVLIAVFILVAASLSYYFYVRQGTRKAAEARAQYTLKNTERMIKARLGKIETIVDGMQLLAEHAIDEPNDMFAIAKNTVEASELIQSAAIAFNEYYYPSKGRWFEAAYVPVDRTLTSTQLGGENHDYTKMEWFINGLNHEEGAWCDPYFDNVDKKHYLMTYALPVHDTSGNVVGAICADVTIDTLAAIIDSIKIYPHSYCALVTTSGVDIVPPPADRKKGKCHTFTEAIDGKNIVLTLSIPDSDMYSHLRRSTLVFAVLALLGMAAVFSIAYRSFKTLWQLNEVRIKEQRIEDELAIARSIQAALLPSAPLTDTARSIDVSGLQVPAKFVGGDLFDYYIRDGKMLFCVGDVSGKGVPAALLMAIAHSLFRVLSAHNDLPERIVADLNDAICENNPDLMFITMFLGILDLETGVVRFCNAGHNPPLLIQDGKAEYLSSEPSLLLGVEPSAKYMTHELELLPGSSLFLYTDGLTEAENVDKELFGEQRALSTAAGFGDLSAEEQLARMRESVHQFVDGAEQSDDLTLLSIRFVKNKNTLSISNDIEDLNKLEPFLNDFFERENLDMSLLSQLNLALEEALINVIMYAYPKGEKGTAELVLEHVNGNVCATLIDSGTPFDPLKRKEVNLDVSLEERQIGGLGIHLIKEIMDEVAYKYEGGRNVLKMKKNVSVSN